MTAETFYKEVEKYIALFDAFSIKHLLEGFAAVDHVCYKCSSADSFESWRAVFESQSDYIYQSYISKRRIAYIKLKTPIPTVLGKIYFLELSDQKPDGSQKEGFDHIEVYPIAFSYEEMVARLAAVEVVKEVIRPHHSTHDIDVGGGFLFRCTREPLIEKIKAEEIL